jgi:hypothetical protein
LARRKLVRLRYRGRDIHRLKGVDQDFPMLVHLEPADLANMRDMRREFRWRRLSREIKSTERRHQRRDWRE